MMLFFLLGLVLCCACISWRSNERKALVYSLVGIAAYIVAYFSV